MQNVLSESPFFTHFSNNAIDLNVLVSLDEAQDFIKNFQYYIVSVEDFFYFLASQSTNPSVLIPMFSDCLTLCTMALTRSPNVELAFQAMNVPVTNIENQIGSGNALRRVSGQLTRHKQQVPRIHTIVLCADTDYDTETLIYSLLPFRELLTHSLIIIRLVGQMNVYEPLRKQLIAHIR